MRPASALRSPPEAPPPGAPSPPRAGPPTLAAPYSKRRTPGAAGPHPVPPRSHHARAARSRHSPGAGRLAGRARTSRAARAAAPAGPGHVPGGPGERRGSAGAGAQGLEAPPPPLRVGGPHVTAAGLRAAPAAPAQRQQQRRPRAGVGREITIKEETRRGGRGNAVYLLEKPSRRRSHKRRTPADAAPSRRIAGPGVSARGAPGPPAPAPTPKPAAGAVRLGRVASGMSRQAAESGRVGGAQGARGGGRSAPPGGVDAETAAPWGWPKVTASAAGLPFEP